MNSLRQFTILNYYLAVAAVLILNISGCSKLPERLKPSGLNSSFELARSLPFPDYIAHYRQIITQTRVDLHNGADQKIIAANTPFELIPDSRYFKKGANGHFARGIVLIHGLSDSPYHMRDLAEHFSRQGFLTRVILLPGHGTRPGDLTEVGVDAWQTATEYAIKSMLPEVDRLFVGGYSLGGALAVNYALANQQELSGLILFNPCLKVAARFAWLAETLSAFKPWLVVREDRDFARYESFTANSGTQINRLVNMIARQTNDDGLKLTIPVLTVLSLDDATVDPWYTLKFFRENITSPASRLLIYRAGEAPFIESDARIIVSPSRLPSQKIIGFSHQSITIPPNDNHYGSKGEYRNCLHYGEKSPEFKLCREGKSDFYGERTGANMDQGILQRLTWNPKFREMTGVIDDFLNDLP